ncbi:type VI secretion system Vgr family protein [Amaricoccus sp.]|uniref:type VI secretion system Vgr family protein n=1 Tax=Amaricoccus sp. TaxID=1872485 RepID=UPI002618E8FA|nr:type VI secretion system tip protein TssI/VgrG [Amaricoccus sp.]HRO10393.1 type VI secretion system tip protein TssI/VgrG [Amaricoccus sp.]
MPEDRAITVETAGGQTLTFTHLDGFDEISRCFEFIVGLVGPELDVEADALINLPLAIEAESGEPKRWIHGLVTEFRLVAVEDRVASYEVVLRPWLWLLALTCDCRIFQNLGVVEIVEEIFGKYPEASFDKRLQKSYPPREYCVQYDESDLDFVQRLLEHEGIFYFFEYSDSGHTLVLADSIARLKPAKGYETVPFHIEDSPQRRDRDFLSRWLVTSSLRPAAYAHADYNFETPSLSLVTQSEAEPVAKLFRGEIYRQPGAHQDLGLGDEVAAIRREELQAPHVRVLAGGTARGLASGCTFTLENHPRESQNAEYLVLRTDYRIVDPEHRPTLAGMGESYRIELVVAPTSLPYRPPRATPRPVMRGPQTATVVGPGGAEIFTDEYARVKVQFHWDRLGKRDENSSCFVRVSAAWAGAGWGFIQIPRIGQEVIVDFIEGDPDRPIITGRVYNAAEMPPYGLPGNETQSGWKSNSSPGGGGYNELMFEDKAGSELVNFQAQKDHNLLVKNDRSKLVQHDQADRIDNNAKHSVGVDLDEDVGNNKTTQVGVDRTVTIGSNDTESVGANRSLTVGVDETISIGSNSSETIGANHTQTVALVQTITVGAARVDTVGAAETRTVGAAQVNTIGGVRQVSVGLAQSHDIGASDSWTIGAGQSVDVGAGQDVKIAAAQSFDVGGARSAKIGADDSTEVAGARALKIGKGSLVEIAEDGAIKVGKDCLIDAGESIVLKCGSAAIAMKKDGTISIEGKDITIKGSGKIDVKASGEITMKGSKINQN